MSAINLARELEQFANRIRNVIRNDGDLSATGQALAIAMIATSSVGILDRASAHLKEGTER